MDVVVLAKIGRAVYRMPAEAMSRDFSAAGPRTTGNRQHKIRTPVAGRRKTGAMQSDMLMFTVSGADRRCDAMPASRLAQLGILETKRRRTGLVDYPCEVGRYGS